MFEVMKPGNESRWQRRCALVLGKKLTKRIIQYFPIDQIGQLVPSFSTTLPMAIRPSIGGVMAKPFNMMLSPVVDFL